MKNQALVFEVAESGFDKYVLENSRKAPVLVEFMGVWSEPCVAMADAIHDLAEEFAERFVFAKVDIDEQPGLLKRFNIQNVPSLLVFRDGEVSFTQEGQMLPDELRLLLKGMGIFRESDELREQARDKHLAGDTPGAILLMTEAINKDPGNTRVALDMIQIFIDVGELEQAKGLFGRLPERDRDGVMGKSLAGQLSFAGLAEKTDGIDVLTTRIANDANDHDARFDRAVCLVAWHDYDGAVDELFLLMERAPGYRDGAAKEMVITITNMLAPNDPERAARFRTRLANLLS